MELTDQRQLCGHKPHIITQQHQVPSLLLDKQFYTLKTLSLLYPPKESNRNMNFLFWARERKAILSIVLLLAVIRERGVLPPVLRALFLQKQQTKKWW